MSINEYKRELDRITREEQTIKKNLDFITNKYTRKILFEKLDVIETEKQKILFKYNIEKEIKKNEELR
jgi:hypothetical protein